jgi:hypothetical protein
MSNLLAPSLYDLRPGGYLLMHSWDEVTAYVRNHYQYEEPGEGYILFVSVDEQGGRNAVFLARLVRPGEEMWVEMTTPVGKVGEVDLNTIAFRIGGHRCGGISIGSDLVLVRHTFPIDSISESAFEKYRAAVTSAARALAASA